MHKVMAVAPTHLGYLVRSAEVGEELVLASPHPIEVHDHHLLGVGVRQELCQAESGIRLCRARCHVKVQATRPTELSKT